MHAPCPFRTIAFPPLTPLQAAFLLSNTQFPHPTAGDPTLQQQAAADAAAAALGSTVSDEDVLRQHHRFLRGPEEEAEAAAAAAGPDAAANWGVRLARRYYNRLFKEYAIADLSRWVEGG